MNGTGKIIVFILFIVGFLIIGMTDSGLNEYFDPDKRAVQKELSTEKNKEISIFDFGKDISTLKENEAFISSVVDGDTINVIISGGKDEKVRMLLIDTPESVHPKKTPQPFGKEASDYAKKVLEQGKKVTLEVGEKDRDKYGRLLAYVWVDGMNFNKHMVEKGYARVAYVEKPNTKYLDEFYQAQAKAKKKKRKIWSIDGYVTEHGFDETAAKK